MINMPSLHVLSLSTILFFVVHSGSVVSSAKTGMGVRGQQRKQQTQNDRNLQSTTNPTFVTIIDSYTDTTELCYSFQTLIHATAYPEAPVIAFTGINLPASEKSVLQACSNRSVKFVDIRSSYTTFPESFTPVPGVNYDYQQTQRFLTTGLWEHKAIEEYDVIVNISDNTCLTFVNSEIPGLGDPEIMYRSQSSPGLFEVARKYSIGLYEAASAYISGHEVMPQNLELYSNLVRVHDNENALPMFNSDFEIVRKSFMQRQDVRAFHDDLTENHSDFFYHKWSSNSIRYLTMSIFGKYGNTDTQHLPGLVQKNILNGNIFRDICRVVA